MKHFTLIGSGFVSLFALIACINGEPTAADAGAGGKAPEHDMCHTGAPLDARSNECVWAICQGDDTCCNSSWDKVCIEHVASACNIDCSKSTATASSSSSSSAASSSSSSSATTGTGGSTGGTTSVDIDVSATALHIRCQGQLVKCEKASGCMKDSDYTWMDNGMRDLTTVDPWTTQSGVNQALHYVTTVTRPSDQLLLMTCSAEIQTVNGAKSVYAFSVPETTEMACGSAVKVKVAQTAVNCANYGHSKNPYPNTSGYNGVF